MRLTILTFACLAIATRAEAQKTWFGPLLAFPVPAGDVGDAQLGIDAGVTLEHMEKSHRGVGVDLIYHYWPASPEYKTAFGRYLRRRYQVIDSPTWAFSAFQATAHLKLMASTTERRGPWIQVGGGIYRVNRNLAETNWDNSVAIVSGPGMNNIAIVPGFYASVGYDFRTTSKMVFGLDANYHDVSSEDKAVPHFSVLTVGTHMLFGW